MHVHTSARLLTYMRVRVSASVPERARIIFIFLTKNFQKFLSTMGFPVWHGISRDARSYIGFASYIALRQLYLPLASDIAHFVRSCGLIKSSAMMKSSLRSDEIQGCPWMKSNPQSCNAGLHRESDFITTVDLTRQRRI